MTVGLLSFAQTTATSPNSQRSLFNMNYQRYTAEYAFINHVFEGTGLGPFGSGYDSISTPWSQLIDITTGYPNNALATAQFGTQIKLPSSANFGGPYVFTWDGEGDLQIGAGTWSETNNTGTNYTRSSNGRWKTVSGQTTTRVVTNVSALSQGLVNCVFQATGGVAGYARNLRIYRLADETDLLAGKIFRSAWKQSIADHNPSAIRFLNWGMGFSPQVRFEHRTPTTLGCYCPGSYFGVGPLYDDVSGTNQYSVAAVTTGVNQTPVSHQHGEMVHARVTNASVRVNTGELSVTAGTVVDGTHVTMTIAGASSPTHPYLVGDRVVHRFETGWTKLDRYPATITATTTNTYTISCPSTASLGTFAAGKAAMYLSLNVGGRGETIVVRPDGKTPYGSFFENAITAKTFNQFYYDKNFLGASDGAGNYSTGVWILSNSSYQNDCPLEIMTAMILELNAISTKPIHMYVNVPYRGLSSIDPDYDSVQNYGTNQVSVIMNGANGYPGLNSNPRINLYVEYGNEIWNFGQDECQQCTWGAYSRWGATAGRGNYADYHTLRAVALSSDVKASNASPRIKNVFGMWFWTGMAPGNFGGNYEKMFPVVNASNPGAYGNLYYNDATVIANGWRTPSNFFEAWCCAPYLSPSSTYCTGSGTGSFTDDVALYNGTTPYSVANPSLATSNFCAQISTKSGDGLGIAGAGGALSFQDQFLTYLPSNTHLINYEGAADWSLDAGTALPGSKTVNSTEQTFLRSVIDSSTWATIQKNYFDSWCARGARCDMPALFLRQGGYSGDRHWSLVGPDSYVGGVEGSAWSTQAVWTALSARNAGLV